MILGINSAYHESAAALIDADGLVIAAAEEERFSLRKHGKEVRVDNAHDLPWHAIAFCLSEAKANWRDLSGVAYSLDPELRRRHACIGYEGDPATFGHPVGEALFQDSLQRVPGLIATRTTAPFFFVPHHVAHAWYAMGTSRFDRAAVLVADGVGEGASLSLGLATRRQMELRAEALFPASVGLAWEKVARYIGLTEYDACKVMALAGSRGDHVPLAPNQLLGFGPDGLWVNQDALRLEFPSDFSGLERAFGPHNDGGVDTASHRQLAAGIQDATERVLVAIASRAVKQFGERRVVFGGGVALNCRANQVLAASGVVDALHVGPAAHDAGTALGAAWHVHVAHRGRELPVQDPLVTRFSGPALENDSNLLHSAGWRKVIPHDEGTSLCDVADALLAGMPVGWLDGRLEFGPRALGGRSLLASPVPRNVVARINGLKGRRAFEPLALAVTEEDADAVFSIPKAGRELATAMLTTATLTSEWRASLAHAVHRDGTARVQVVRSAVTPRFHALLRCCAERGGIPLLINTSFNLRGDPMPATLAQALTLPRRLGISHLAVNGHLWESKP